MKISPYFISSFLLFFFLLLVKTGYAQETEEKIYRQEIRVDLFQLIVLPGIEVSYERFIDPQSSWGVSGFINFDGGLEQGYRFETFELSPFYRLYFQNKQNSNEGFFVQPFLSLTQGIYENYNDSNDYYTESDYFGFAAGALIGRKWVNKLKYIFEIHAGVGRFLNFEEGSAYPRINFAIGKRF